MKIEEKDAFIRELQEEVGRARKVNEKLMELAHRQTRDMVENLSPGRRPLKASDAPIHRDDWEMERGRGR